MIVLSAAVTRPSPFTSANLMRPGASPSWYVAVGFPVLAWADASSAALYAALEKGPSHCRLYNAPIGEPTWLRTCFFSRVGLGPKNDSVPVLSMRRIRFL